MTTFHVYQPRLTDAQIVELNATGWNAKPEFRLYAKITGGFNVTPHDYFAAARLGLMAHAWTVEADDVNEVFTLANYMPGRGTAVKVDPQAKSMSVGDVVVMADASNILGWSGQVCARMGFDPMNGVALRQIIDAAPLVLTGGVAVTPEEV